MQVQEVVRSALIDWVHDVGIDVTKEQADKLAKLVEEKFTSTNMQSMPCQEFTDGLEWCHLGFAGINCGAKPCVLSRHTFA